MSRWRSQRWHRTVAVVLVAGTALVAGLAPSRSAAEERSGAAVHSAPRPVPVGNTFPIPAPHDVSFSDSWHACRDGCRRQHKGNDLMADEGTPMVAVESGVIARVDDVDDSNGGRSVWLLGDSGVAYWYAHNSANLVVAGQPVARGQVIARVGHTGNARTTPPHIHFQVNTCGELTSAEPCTVDPHEALRAWPQELIDGGADALGLYTPTDASFRLRTDGGSPLPARTFGSAGEAGGEGGGLPVAGDWDGDGRDTVGVYRPADATFLRSDDAGTPLPPVRYGQPGDLPVVGDWDGDGRDSVGHYRPATATFHLYDEAGRALPPVPFGTPVAAPDPVTRPAATARPETVVRSGVNLAAVARAAGPPVPSGTTFVEPSPEPVAGAAGPPAIVPVAGDWDGDRRDTLALFRPADATFVVRDDSGAARPAARYGHPGDLPLVGDWDGDGRDTLGVYRAPEASFHLQGFTDREPAAGPGVARVRAEVGDGSPVAPAAVPEPDGPVVFGPAGAPGALPVAGDWNGHDLVTADDLHAIFGAGPGTGPGFDEAAVAEELPLLNQVLVRSGAVTPARKAALLVTLHRESGLRHDAVGSGSSRWRGRGFVQLTGEADYRQAGRDLRMDLAADPDLAVEPAISAEIASWRWTVAGNLNHAADRLDVAAVAIALGYRSDPAEDRGRCDDFRRALAWFTGGDTPAGVNCERTPEAIAIAQEAMEPARPATGPAGPDVPADLPHPPGPLDTAPARPPVVSPPPGPTPAPTTTRPPTRPSPPTGRPPTAPTTTTTTTTTTPSTTTTTTTTPPPSTTTTTTTPEPPATTTTSEPATTTTVATEPAPPGA